MVDRIMRRDGRRCWLCGEPCDFELSRDGRYPHTTLDHVIPKSKGGGSAPENLRLAHKKCNNDRGSKDAEPHHAWLHDGGVSPAQRDARQRLLDAGFSHAQAMAAIHALGIE